MLEYFIVFSLKDKRYCTICFFWILFWIFLHACKNSTQWGNYFSFPSNTFYIVNFSTMHMHVFFSLSHLFLFRSALRVWFYLAAVLTIDLVIDNMFNYFSVDSILRYLSKNYLNGFVKIIIYTKYQLYSCCASLLLSQTYKNELIPLYTVIVHIDPKC